MQWHPLESKMLTAAAFDAERRMLYLRFTSGDVYRYSEVPGDSFDELLRAESKGRYFLAAIRDQFRYERLAKLHVA
jgi:hypothetical protein